MTSNSPEKSGCPLSPTLLSQRGVTKHLRSAGRRCLARHERWSALEDQILGPGDRLCWRSLPRIRLAPDAVPIAVQALRETPLVAIKRRDSSRADFITARICIARWQGVQGRLALLCIIPCIAQERDSETGGHSDNAITNGGLERRLLLGRRLPIALFGTLTGIVPRHRTNLLRKPQVPVKLLANQNRSAERVIGGAQRLSHIVRRKRWRGAVVQFPGDFGYLPMNICRQRITAIPVRGNPIAAKRFPGLNRGSSSAMAT